MGLLPALAMTWIILLPLALAPAWFFYYDITPKACMLWVGAAIILVASLWKLDQVIAAWRTRAARLLAGLFLGLIVVAALAALASPFPHMAWMGSTWRRGGALTEIAIVTLALVLASVSREVILRAMCIGGIAAA